MKFEDPTLLGSILAKKKIFRNLPHNIPSQYDVWNGWVNHSYFSKKRVEAYLKRFTDYIIKSFPECNVLPKPTGSRIGCVLQNKKNPREKVYIKIDYKKAPVSERFFANLLYRLGIGPDNKIIPTGTIVEGLTVDVVVSPDLRYSKNPWNQRRLGFSALNLDFKRQLVEATFPPIIDVARNPDNAAQILSHTNSNGQIKVLDPIIYINAQRNNAFKIPSQDVIDQFIKSVPIKPKMDFAGNTVSGKVRKHDDTFVPASIHDICKFTFNEVLTNRGFSEIDIILLKNVDCKNLYSARSKIGSIIEDSGLNMSQDEYLELIEFIIYYNANLKFTAINLDKSLTKKNIIDGRAKIDRVLLNVPLEMLDEVVGNVIRPYGKDVRGTLLKYYNEQVTKKIEPVTHLPIYKPVNDVSVKPSVNSSAKPPIPSVTHSRPNLNVSNNTSIHKQLQDLINSIAASRREVEQILRRASRVVNFNSLNQAQSRQSKLPPPKPPKGPKPVNRYVRTFYRKAPSDGLPKNLNRHVCLLKK